MHVFVYGTLKRGQRANRLMDGTQIIGDAFVFGDLYDLGGFPGLKIGGDRVARGELYALPPNDHQQKLVLERLDRYEGVPHLYTRRPITAWVAGKAFEAQTYEYNGDIVTDEHLPNGVWG